MTRVAQVAMVGLVGTCVLLIGWLIWGAVTSPDTTAIDDLPTVSEVVIAQAHQHGIDLPELTENDVARLSAAPSAASTLTAYDQVRDQLLAVKTTAGASEALAILGEIAVASDEISGMCPQLYADVTSSTSESVPPLVAICPGSGG